ncbi:sugar phosphate isomerase/epimerase [Streptosporangium sp. 'caverna']|uniref:sugar phosphate isomerase/epimerase family protein n=1 Tax=Streptosporangium sp. 'caverna' TaxID=2202249 RepID=UPI000D7EA627|nr:sugar phosphate isomerase/epimerase family protein [Streptosporangium sp. 'caverna']AWS44560.1 xylose isomerase [Streptosporangium sp. 'caverna']
MSTAVDGLRFGYGTNGFANHRLTDACEIIAGLGYTGVALTLDHDHLDPYAPGLAGRVAELADRLRDLGLGVVIETGARYLLDPWHKHAPTLLHDERETRLDFLRRAIAIGEDLGAEAVSFWAGVRPDEVSEDVAWERLVDGCAQLVAPAEAAGVPLGFEPEPGMLVESIAGWRRLREALGAPAAFGLTLDIGHCRCLEPDPVPSCVTAVADHVVNVQIDDMRRGVHEHLEFGEGEIDFPPVLRALGDAGYRGLVAVELPRHSHAAPSVAARSIDFLRAAEREAAAVRESVTGAGTAGEREAAAEQETGEKETADEREATERETVTEIGTVEEREAAAERETVDVRETVEGRRP